MSSRIVTGLPYDSFGYSVQFDNHRWRGGNDNEGVEVGNLIEVWEMGTSLVMYSIFLHVENFGFTWRSKLITPNFSHPIDVRSLIEKYFT